MSRPRRAPDGLPWSKNRPKLPAAARCGRCAYSDRVMSPRFAYDRWVEHQIAHDKRAAATAADDLPDEMSGTTAA